MRAQFGRDPTAVSKIVSFNFISRLPIPTIKKILFFFKPLGSLSFDIQCINALQFIFSVIYKLTFENKFWCRPSVCP